MLILDGHTSPVYALAFSPDSYWLASGAKDGYVRLWDAVGGRRDWSYPLALDGVNGIDFSPDGRAIGVASVIGWYSRHVEPGGDPAGKHSGSVTGVRFLTPDLLAVGHGQRAKSESGHLGLWDVTANRRREPVFNEPHGVRSVAAHPPSRTVAWSNGSRRVTVWDIVKPDPVHFNLPHTSPAVAFHPDGTHLAVAQEWGAKVFDLARREEVATLEGHKGKVTSVAFSPDGRTLATGSWDGTVRTWEPLTGAERQTFTWPTGRVFAVAYSPDGTRAAAGGDKGTVVVWDTE